MSRKAELRLSNPTARKLDELAEREENAGATPAPSTITTTPRSKLHERQDGEKTRPTTIHLPISAHKALKHYSVDTDTPMSEVVIKALESLGVLKRVSEGEGASGR